MAFIFTCGTHVFQRLLEGYEQVTVRCQNCGNYSAKVFRRWEWFTLCFIPVIPFSLKPWHEVGCHICNFYQDLQYRPDAQNANRQPLPAHPYGQPAPYTQPQYGAGAAGISPPPQAVAGNHGGLPAYK